MVPEGTTRKPTSCRSALRSASIYRFISRSALAIPALLFTGVSFLVTPDASGQDAPARYSPPVHVQPAAWSVLESPTAANQQVSRPPAPSISHGQEIANMAQYMRNQNQAVTASQEAQVNAALNQLQYARSSQQQARQHAHQQQTRQQQTYQQQTRQAPAYPYPRQASANVQVQQQQQQAAPQPQRQTFVKPRTIAVRVPQAPVQTVQRRRGVGLQDRISGAIKKTFTRPEPRRMVAQQIPTQARQRVHSNQIAAVGHTVAVSEEPELPLLADESTRPPVSQKRPNRARNLEYRPQRKPNDRVIVPSFVESEKDVMPELKLASTQEPVGSGLRRPSVSAHSKPLSYGTRTTKQDRVSVFRNASTEPAPAEPILQDVDQNERLQQLKNEFDAERRLDLDNELPQRPEEDDGPSLLGMEDKDSADEARRARSELDAELDALEDDEDDLEIDEDEEDTGPPVFDERSCEELRGLLLDNSIRDISLDISPPASPRRSEIANISRSWTDASGTVLATGTMVDLRRGYVILDSGQKLPYGKLSEADWSAIAENWLLPTVCSLGQRGSVQRNWTPQTVSWHASSLCHKPLYFENVQLERYGHSHGPYMQPVQSAFHFFRSVFFLPYKTAINPPNECQYSLGFYRPGNCAPWLIDPIPFSRQGIRRQALSSVGLSFIP